MSEINSIREDVLRNPRYPVHKIADQLLPYLRVLVEQFHPREVVLFGSFAYGQPDEHSDVDLLVVKPIESSRLKDKIMIRAAWVPVLMSGRPLSFDLLLATPEEDAKRRLGNDSYYHNITEQGLRLA